MCETSSFHFHQGRLTNWTKGFSCSGVEGEDVVQLLRDAIDRHPKNIKIDVCAILVKKHCLPTLGVEKWALGRTVLATTLSRDWNLALHLSRTLTLSLNPQLMAKLSPIREQSFQALQFCLGLEQQLESPKEATKELSNKRWHQLNPIFAQNVHWLFQLIHSNLKF